MKKYKLLGVLIAVIVLTLVGCGDDSSSSRRKNSSDSKSDSDSTGELSETWYKESSVVKDYFAAKGVSVEELIIENTYTEGREHEASVSVVAKNGVASLNADYTIKSRKYDSGKWEIESIYASGKEVYLPISDPVVNIHYDDSEVVITSTEMEDQGDNLRFLVYYDRVFDGTVAKITEKHYKDYFWDKKNSNDWKTYDLKDKWLSSVFEIKDIECIFEAESEDGKHIAQIGVVAKNGKLSISELDATVYRNSAFYSKEHITTLNGYVYDDLEVTMDEHNGINARMVDSPCDKDYSYVFPVYCADEDKETSALLFVAPEQLWLVIYYDGANKIQLLGN